MNEDFIFRLGADVSSFTKSITEVEAELKSARAAVKTALGDDLIQANKYVEDLEESLKNLKSIGVQVPGAKEAATGLKNISPAAQKAQNTLTGLSGVVRDLPFGFIAIQNNLPVFADQFTALTKEAGGVGGALKNLGGALIGPAGIAFAFGAVTSIVTSLIQEYGSLGEAINVILGITKPLTEAQKAYNKASVEASANAATEEAKVKILTKTLLDNKAPQKDRLAAYGELKKVAPDVVAGIKDENALTNESNILIAANSKLRAESVRLKVQEAGITAALTANESKIAELRLKLDKVTQDYVKSAKELSNANKDNIVTGFGSVTAQQSALTAFNNNAKAVKELQGQINALTGENQSYLNQLDPVVLGLAKINEQTRDQIEGLKKSNEETQTAESNAKKRAEALKREAKAIEKRNAAERLARSERAPLQVSFDIAAIGKQDYGALYKKNVIDKFKEAQKKAGNVVIPVNLPEIDTAKILQQLTDIQNATKARREAILKEANLQAATDLFESTFFNPVQDLFSDLLNGADGAFKAFAKAVLQAINQIVAKIIATGIISLLANILFPGAGATGTLLSKVGKDIIGALGFKGVANDIKNSFDFTGVANNLQNAINSVNTTLNFEGRITSIANAFDFSNIINNLQKSIDSINNTILLNTRFDNLSNDISSIFDFSSITNNLQNAINSVSNTINFRARFENISNDISSYFNFSSITNNLQNAIESINTSLLFQGSLPNINNPNFGNINAGALNMAGAVSVVLRGQDLVGSLNRTNAQISRVG